MTKNETIAIQRRLNEIGLAYQTLGENLEEDGIYGKRTREVHRAWLDQDAEVPTITPEAAKPWWQSRAILGLLTVGLAWAAGKAGWLIDDEQITQILLAVMEAVGLAVAAIGTVRRKGAIDPTLVMRLPHGRDLRLPVLPNRKDRTGVGGDPGPFGF
jgi:hypothetical protein